MEQSRLARSGLVRLSDRNGHESVRIRSPYLRFPRAMEDRSDVAVVGRRTMRPPLPLTPDEGAAEGVVLDALAAVPKRKRWSRRSLLAGEAEVVGEYANAGHASLCAE
jgi:hypothetical protein